MPVLRCRCFGLEVEDLSDDACLPIQAAVEPGPERIEGRAVLGEHGHCEDAIGSDFLIAARLLGGTAGIPLLQEEERQGPRTPGWSGPDKAPIHRFFERLPACGISQEGIEAGRQVHHAVDEEQEIDARAPRQRGEQDLARAWHDLE